MGIMVVDDEEGIRQLLTMFLAHNGYTAVSFSNGAKALAYLQESSELPELILLDMMMPVMDGAAFRHAQLQRPTLAGIPVVIMSAAAELSEQVRLLQTAGAIAKPIDFQSLIGLVSQYCLHDKERVIGKGFTR
jgi:CheY-like chemotaxis protein